MTPGKKGGRIPTGAGPEAWVAPFAGLDLGPLPPGPADKPPEAAAPPRHARLVLRRETAHRHGKTVIVVEGFGDDWREDPLDALLHELKSKLGCGGTRHGRTLEIQGEQGGRLAGLLEARGFAVRGDYQPR